MNSQRKRSEIIPRALRLGVFTIISGGVEITDGLSCRVGQHL